MARTTTRTRTTSTSTNVVSFPFKGDSSNFRPASEEFQCSERLAESSTTSTTSPVVLFQCTLPNSERVLSFQCLEPSCGVLLKEEETAAAKEEDGAMDPFFFDSGYTLAGKTGFQVWPGARLLVEALTFANRNATTTTSSSSLELTNWQQRIAKEQPRVLELGSGVGVVGTSLAAAGAQVLLTDLKTLVEHSTQPNLERNKSSSSSSLIPVVAPSWLPQDKAVPIGKGWAATTAVDWTIPLWNEQIQEDIVEQVEVILASDCVWLVSMMEPLFDTVDSVFCKNPKATFLLSFQRRDPKNTTTAAPTTAATTTATTTTTTTSMFTTVDRVLSTMQHERNWSVKCLAWRPMDEDKHDDHNDDEPKEVFLFEATRRITIT